MKVIIAGNGIAGTMAAKNLREMDSKVELEIFAEEKFLYYPRPNLIEFLAGKMPFERVFGFHESWYSQQHMDIHLENPIRKIFPETREVETSQGRKVKYDRLLLANGSFAFVPPIGGADKKGVFTLRTLDDALNILEYTRTHEKAAVIGGGLLGLEIARALKARGASVEIIEFFKYLLPRQLDEQGASLLKDQIEKMGIRVHLNSATEEITGDQEAKGLNLKGGKQISANLVLVAAGVRPNIEIAKDAGLETDHGLIVGDDLRTSQSEIYAAGDNVQHKEKLYGIIPASFEQARVAASNVLGQKMTYKGTIPSNTLKVVGLYVTSIGLVNPEESGFEEIRMENKEKGIYKKVVLKNGTAAGAIWMGTKNGVNGITRVVAQGMNVEKWKESILEDDFDFSAL